MSFLNPAGDLLPFEEVVPESARFTGLSRSSLLTQRKRVRVVPQGGRTAGIQTGTSAGTGGGGTQLQFLVADKGGLVDMRSMTINYWIRTTGSAAPDDGHPFTTVQVSLNGQLLDNIQNACKLTNVEMKMGSSKSYYQTAGSLQGFELLNNDLCQTIIPATYSNTASAFAGWGQTALIAPDVYSRCSGAGNVYTNNYPGEQRSIPLGLISGVGRMKSYLPISILGELQLTLITGSAADVVFCPGTTTTGDYSLAGISLEYDVVVPDPRFMEYLQKVAYEPGAGLNMPYESSIVSSGGQIATSGTLKESTIIVSRATNHLLRSSLIQIPATLTSSVSYPSQSCFSHAGTWSIQWRIGSQAFPQIPAEGDASMFQMSQAAYGCVVQENGSVVNRMLWGNSTDPAGAATITPAVLGDSESGLTVPRYAYADSFIPTYGFTTVKGAAEPLAVDGVSLSGASGSQVQISLVSAPATNYVPYVVLTALKFISAKQGAVTVVGA